MATSPQLDRTPARDLARLLDSNEIFSLDGHVWGFQITTLKHRPNREKTTPAPWWILNNRAFLEFGRFFLDPDKKGERDRRRRARWHHALRNLVILRLAYSVCCTDSEIADELDMTTAAVKARRLRMLTEGERFFRVNKPTQEVCRCPMPRV